MINSISHYYTAPVVIFLLAAACGGAAAQDSPPAVTTDTREYCLQLHERVENLRNSATTPPPAAVADLSAEGQRMCENGLSRGGVMRLRRALTIIKRTNEDR